jgi:potassium efflux system protein
VVTAVAVRNVGALLDIVLLQRIEIQADATYAIKVVARYALTAAGVMLASNILGIGWSDVQWLVAALSVGLGFGLQEIFANFVSGLIILAERPIRIGDVVTVGDVSGTVSRIRARATMLVDFDNKEVLIPNKSFITDRVINWTLSNQTTRLLLKISVPTGTDMALAQRVILETVQRNPDVLRQPAPSVFFIGFGASSLDFEIHAFVDSLNKRLRVQHEINVAVDGVLREKGIKTP